MDTKGNETDLVVAPPAGQGIGILVEHSMYLSWASASVPCLLKQLLIGPALCAFGLMFTGAHANEQNEGLQICDPNAWKTTDYAIKAAAMSILTGLFIFKIVNRLLRTVPEAAQVLPEVVPALVVYPAVQGDDIDDVLKNAPVATRRNSPLESWL